MGRRNCTGRALGGMQPIRGMVSLALQWTQKNAVSEGHLEMPKVH